MIAAAYGLARSALKDANPLGLGSPAAVHGLIAVNTAVLGAALVSARAESFLYGALSGVFGGAGFLLAVVLLASVRERIALSDVPAGSRAFRSG
jgi:electron transport complex protein RnfA